MTKIDIKECEGGGGGATTGVTGVRSSKSVSPARREAGVAGGAASDNTATGAKTDNIDLTKNSDKNREGVSNESGYFEDDEETSSLQQEDSIEIIFDKNASNNNTGQSSEASGKIIYYYVSMNDLPLNRTHSLSQQFNFCLVLKSVRVIILILPNITCE